MVLTPDQKTRYDRQLLVNGWDEAAQDKLGAASVFVAGAGGLGSAALAYLVAAGVGHVTVCDDDRVELSNLNRQVLYSTQQVGQSKAQAAAERLSALNPDVMILPRVTRITSANVADLTKSSDLILDCLDNQATRSLLNREAVRRGIPFIHAAVSCFNFYLAVLHTPHTPCLRCLIPEVQAAGPTPVPGFTAGFAGAVQAMEAIRLLVGFDSPILGKLVIFDGARWDWSVLATERDPHCPVCGQSSP